MLAVGRYHVYDCPHWNDTTSCIATLVPHSGNGAKATATASSKAGGMIGEDPERFSTEIRGAENASFEPQFNTKNDQVYQDRLGTNIEGKSRKSGVFCTGMRT